MKNSAEAEFLQARILIVESGINPLKETLHSTALRAAQVKMEKLVSSDYRTWRENYQKLLELESERKELQYMLSLLE
jgi:hypothetical protein